MYLTHCLPQLIQFLVTMVGNQRGLGMKRKLPLMLNDASQLQSSNKIAKISSLPLDDKLVQVRPNRYRFLDSFFFCNFLRNELVLVRTDIYCDVPGSPCLSKTGLMYGAFFFLKFFIGNYF